MRRLGADFGSVVIRPNQLPRLPGCEVALLFEVLEHTPSPLAVIQHVGAVVKPGGVLIENFYAHAHPTAADLDSAEHERPAVYAWLNRNFRLISGQHWDAPEGGGTRAWRATMNLLDNMESVA